MEIKLDGVRAEERKVEQEHSRAVLRKNLNVMWFNRHGTAKVTRMELVGEMGVHGR